MRSVLILAILFLLLPTVWAAQEASGEVISVVDGDTIDVQLPGQEIRVRLADIDAPEMGTLLGPIAKQFTTKWLQSNSVSLDIDDKRRTDSYGRTIAVVYLLKPDGTVENFNKKLVDAGQACIWDFSDNEFDPADWWDGAIPATACVKSDSSDSTPSVSTFGQGAKTGASVASSSSGTFVGSAKSNKYHYPSCSAAKKIKSSNLVTFSSSADARASGYVPCGICHPP
jgi:micrococcal nuclease